MSELTKNQDCKELNPGNQSFTEEQLRLKREHVNAAVEVVGNDHQKIEEFLKMKYMA